jgi:hypothetical protein
LFSVADRERMIEYVKTNLRNQLQVEAPVHAVSVFGADAALCDQWFESELRPFLAQHHELAIASQKRKIGALREAVTGALERRSQAGSEAISSDTAEPPNEATEALRNGDRVLERAQGEAFFLTRKIAKMQPAIIDAAAQKIAAALVESDDVDAGSILATTLTAMLAEPVAGTLRSIEQTRDALAGAMHVAASVSDGAIPDELPKPTGMPTLDTSEISKKVLIEKPAVVSLFGKGMLASHVRRKLENEYDRTLLEFLSLYANRLRRWMEQSINALRTAFNAFADMHRAHFEGAPDSGSADMSAIQSDLRILREWEAADQESVIGST